MLVWCCDKIQDTCSVSSWTLPDDASASAGSWSVVEPLFIRSTLYRNITGFDKAKQSTRLYLSFRQDASCVTLSWPSYTDIAQTLRMRTNRRTPHVEQKLRMFAQDCASESRSQPAPSQLRVIRILRESNQSDIEYTMPTFTL